MSTRASATVRAAKNRVVVEPIFRLVVTKGPDAGTTFTLDGTEAPRVLLGTSPACQLRLTDRQTSRRHLALEVDGGLLHVRDLGSTNGTRVNGVGAKEVFLSGGETLQVGESSVEIVRDDVDGEPLVSDETSFGRYLGESVAMRRLYPFCRNLAASAAPLVIEGETGTGKELLAEVLHEEGPRASGPFVVFDCAATAAADAEAALFGRDARGLFEEADGGTLLLDEIAELDLAVQSRLVRAIERGEVRRAGGSTQTAPVDVRVIAASRRDLDREVAAKRFREDLFFRIAVTRIELPPLRRRAGDVELLGRRFWERARTGRPFPEEALDRLRAYEWPGNVRELENMIVRLAALGDVAPPRIADPQRRPAPGAPRADYIDEVIGAQLPLTQARERVVAEFERRYVEDAFERNGRSVTRAAAASGIARRYFRTLRARQREQP